MAKKEEKTLGTAIDEIVRALEGLEPNARTTAVKAACSHLGISIGMAQTGSFAQSTSDGSTLTPARKDHDTQVNDIRTFKDEKNPNGSREMACVIAYYLQYLAPANERKETIMVADVEKYFKQAKFRLPKRIQQTLVDAKSAGYFDLAERGSYKLNPVGYNLVAHTLPRSKSES